MKKITSLLAFFLASLCSFSTWAAERVAPTMPTSAAPETEQTYYLYNLDAELFYGCDVYGYLGYFSETPIAISLEKVDSRYIIKLSSSWENDAIYAYDTSIGYGMYNPSDIREHWEITTAQDGSYRIQWSSELDFYDANLFLGKKADSENLRPDCTTEEQIRWAFIPVNDAAERFVAEMKLYRALCAVDAYSDKGFYLAEFENNYTNRASLSVDELTASAKRLRYATGISSNYKNTWWNEKPILFYTDEGENSYETDGSYYTWEAYGNSIERRLNSYNHSGTISAIVNLSEESVIAYTPGGWSNCTLDVYIDDTKVRHLEGDQTYPSGRLFETLSAGVHIIKWVYAGEENFDYGGYYWGVSISNVGIIATPLISVSLLEPGSLGTEVLYADGINSVKDVRRLKVTGKMNDDDWERIKMMTGLQTLDLSEAEIAEIPEEQFSLSNDTAMQFLHAVTLPEGLKRINGYAFNSSYVETLNFPSTLEKIDHGVFQRSYLKNVSLPDGLTDIGIYSFNDMKFLESAKLPANLEVISERAFQDCKFLETVIMPENLKEIKREAFSYCNKLRNVTLPESLTIIGSDVFEATSVGETIVIPKNVTYIGGGAFSNCNNLKHVELNAYQFKTEPNVLYNCPNLETLKLNSPTVVTRDGTPLSDIKTLAHLQVPQYLVNLYKQDSYWYNAQSIEGFDYSDMEYIPLHGDLTLSHDRFGGNPSVMIDRPNYLKILGEGDQQFNNLTISRDYNDSYGYGMIYSDCPNLTINGDLCVQYKTNEREWNFICLPFDLDISRISHDQEDVQFAIRYYDGANRAENGKSGSWKDYERTAVIPAGTGFILQTNKECFTYLYAANTDAKQNIVSPNEFSKTLEQHDAELASNRGWNLVGNPYQCFYNNHMINYPAPITVWNFDSRTYTAYSLTDDDYALRPNEAFFVQCPGSEAQTISFPVQGRQLTSVIESQNAVKAKNPAGQSRLLVDLGLSFGDAKDKTRVVFNDEAEMGYEISCDAGKFMSMDKEVAQLYTLDAEGLHYAINERPTADGKVQLGFYTARNGSYTLSAERNQAGDIYLTDLVEGVCVNLATEDYTFKATAGTDETRFVLSLTGKATGIDELDAESQQQKEDLYDLSGRRVSKAQKGVFIQNGKKVVVK